MTGARPTLIRPRCGGRFLVAALLLCLAGSGFSASRKEATPAGISEKKSDLGELRQRLERLKKDVASSESARSEVADELRDQERAISDLQRELLQLGQRRGEMQMTLDDLGRQTSAAENQLGGHRQRLDALLRRQYTNGIPDALRLLLSGSNPNQVARDITYLSIIARSRMDIVEQTTSLLGERRKLAEKTRQQADELLAVEALQRQQHQQLVAQRALRQKTLKGISGKLLAQRKELKTLRRDEQRMAKLIDRLTKLMASESRKKRALAPAGRAPQKNGGGSATRAGEIVEGAGLAVLRGKLPPPADGRAANRFGSRQDGGGHWKGLFFLAAAGSDVRAVADGQVVFADWLRGFGNLMVVDHGEGYLSVYGYNEALLKEIGSDVRSGDRIATVGSSGGRSETGLYFELRRQGEPLDPSAWLRR